MSNRSYGHRPRRRYRGSQKTSKRDRNQQYLLQAILAAEKNNQLSQSPQKVEEVYIPKHKFTDFAFCDKLQNNIAYRKYKIPSPIQDKAIPPLLEGRDLIGIANTGTGKTAAFLLPTIQKVYENNSEKVLIVAPTRELAMQIHNEWWTFAYKMNIRDVVCVGGMSIGKQLSGLSRNPNFVIGTPGRLRDLIQRKALNLSQFRTIILDETDRMVDIGFMKDIQYFISLLPKNRQSLFFSATIPAKAKQMLNQFVTNPVRVEIAKQNPSQNVFQKTLKVARDKKFEALQEILNKDTVEKALVFGRTKHGVQKIADKLAKRGFRVEAIHGNKRQNQRVRTLDRFKQDKIQTLLATDVASRGIDVKDITHVINYDLPETFNDYIHRIGRTGRMHKRGVALTFID